MKITVFYDSRTNNTSTMAECIVEGMMKVDGVEAKAFHIDAIDDEFAAASEAYVFGTPTYAGGPTAEMYSFLLNRAAKYGLAGHLGGVFATQQYIHGGADVTMLRMAETLLVFGMMIYSGGGSQGSPVIHFGPVEVSPNMDAFKDLFRIYGERFAKQAVAVTK
ncbi:MAG: flavodoxin domain-containing protein [Solobacterium sp.]|nr:flavodoxin domain-containing protein [Solobacterium sp.]MBQ6591795.1 flavodoxin domain-containing protein [Solobacterium sp.]